MTAFVILHYRAIDTTRSCVKSIRALAGDKHIVIVDNASPNGTGAVLAEEFAASPDVTVLLHGKNDGFARGNNVGTRWVYEHLDADFTVVLNNDVEIPQHDFIPQIARIYAQHPFDLLGPDIVSVFSGIHQSPKTLHGCTLESVRHKRACVARSKNPILLLLSSGELTGQLLVGRAELITFLLNGGDLLTDSLLVTGGLSSLSGELIDLSVQLIDLTLELLILGGQRAVGFLGFAELGRDKLCCLIIASLSGLLGLSHSVLQTSILRLELLHLTGKIGDLRIKVGHVRTQSLGGLTAGYRLTSKSLDGFRDLIKEVIDLVDIITFLESNSLEGMLPNILRRQQSHKSCTSLWGIARTYVGLKSECYHDPIVSEHSTWVFMPDICLRRVKNGLRTLSEQHFPVPPAQNTAQ